MTKDNIIFIGLDTHKESTEVAYGFDERESSPIHFGKIPLTKQAFTKLARQFKCGCTYQTTGCDVAFDGVRMVATTYESARPRT